MNTPDLSFYNSRRYGLTLAVVMAVFFYLFLIFFLPFGVSNFDPDHQYTIEFLLEISHFLGITLVAGLVNELVVKPAVLKRVSTRTIIAWSIWTLLLLGMANFLTYNILGNWHDFHFSSAVMFVVNCSTVLIFPLVGTFFYFRYRSLQEKIDHFQSGTRTNLDVEQLITFAGAGAKDKIALSVSTFLYVRAHDNYAAIHYLEQGRPVRQLIRASLGGLMESITHEAVVRCHRSYLVNLVHVQAVKGGKKTMTLYVGPASTPVPTSNSYRQVVREGLHRLKHFA
ncbi:MAG: LytTR family DNA-binding domain-containing protein [Saprospiraceae bacterium]|nr:LytTR family DNA-binding domain-containing protein [Saprospiraceae bacterium]